MRITARFEFKAADCWIGVFWKRAFTSSPDGIDPKALHIWLCLVPMLPLHLILLRPEPETPWNCCTGEITRGRHDDWCEWSDESLDYEHEADDWRDEPCACCGERYDDHEPGCTIGAQLAMQYAETEETE